MAAHAFNDLLKLGHKNSASIALVDDSLSSITYGDLIQKINRPLLLNRKGLVFLFVDNSIDSVIHYLTLIGNELPFVLLNAQIDCALLSNLTKCYKPNYFVGNESLLKAQSDQDILIDNGFCYQQISDKPIHTIHPDVKLFLPTSGSTGAPKLVKHGLRNILASATNISTGLKILETEKTLLILPLYYTMGLSVLNSHLFAGATTFLSNETVVSKYFWSYLNDQKITSFTGVPFTFELIEKFGFLRKSFPHLTKIYQGGGKLSTEQIDKFWHYAEQHDLQFIQTYGQTEGTARMSVLFHDEIPKAKGSIGKAINGLELFVSDKNGVLSAWGEAEGELYCIGDNVTFGYVNSIDELSEGDQNSRTLATGDIVKRDLNGFLYIIGRKSRFIKLYSHRIGLDELEYQFFSQLQIESACTGSDEGLEVYITQQESLDAVSTFLSNHLQLPKSAYKVNYIEYLPRNSFGKIQYNELTA